jgi:hypothetical protein
VAQPHRRYPPELIVRVVAAALVGQRRSLLRDMVVLSSTLHPPLQVHRPQEFRYPLGSVLFVFNHYTRPDVPAWWSAVALGSALVQLGLHQPEPRWVMTATWRHWGAFEPLSRWMFRRLAATYGLLLMPPMPPEPREVEARAAAVRQVMAYARSMPQARVCLAPEGYDANDGRLITPPPGVGRFMLHLCRAGLVILPVGVWEDAGVWHVRLGQAFALDAPREPAPAARDEWAARSVMGALAALLPERLRGEVRPTQV